MAANSSACGDVISVCYPLPYFADKTYIVDLLRMHIIAHHGRRCRLHRLNMDSLDGVFLRFRHCLELDDVFAKINASCNVAPVGCDLETGEAQDSV
ncbi:hypothetical protein DPV78_011017 [Talaromyces pinophilus]|nr:hypothetical protein DPV78_011017 [Talaromyces pinophilus]